MSKERDYRAEIVRTTNFIGDCYFIDPERKAIGDAEIKHWNTALLVASYLMDKNPLIVGEPGFAKTTGAKVVSSVLSGLPFDLYEAAQIQGHPDQTFETMLARLDFAKLKEQESVIWLLSAYLPVKIIDEVNRLPSGNQDELLNSLETGRFNYLNSTLYIGKTPFFATANHPDDGNHILIPPLRDRFSIHVEVGHIGATYRGDIANAEQNIAADLRDEELTDKIIRIINDPQLSVKERLQAIDQEKSGFVRKLVESDEIEVSVFDQNDRTAVQKQMYAVPLSTEAELFLQMIDAELNYSPTYGRKRSNDRVDTSNHSKKLASYKTKNGCSPRGVIKGIEHYAQAVAYLLGDERVEKVHLLAVAPYALGHRLDFTDDFKKDHEDRKRSGDFGQTKEMFLAEKLVEGVEVNYCGDPQTPSDKGVKQTLDLLFTARTNPGTLDDEQKAAVQEMLTNIDKLDHPLVREYAKRMVHEKK